MFKEYDVVLAKREIENVPKSTKGTVLVVYDGQHFEVEFVDENGETINVLTVGFDDIEKDDTDLVV